MFSFIKTLSAFVTLAHLCLLAILYLALFDPQGHEIFSRPPYFLPFVEIFYQTGAGLCIAALVLISPLCSDGSETYHISSPLGHSSGRLIAFIGAATLPLLVLTLQNDTWQALYVRDAALHATACTAVAFFVATVAFYAQKRRARLKKVITAIAKRETQESAPPLS